MNELLKGAQIPNSLPENLKAIIRAGFVERNECILLASELSRSHGGDAIDRVGYECFVNHVHIDNFPDAWLFANELLDALKQVFRSKCAVIVSVDGKKATVRFHQVGSEKSWLHEDLDDYEDEAIAVLYSN